MFSNPATTLVTSGPLTVLGSDTDGWIHMQINLQTLCADDSLSTDLIKVTKGTWNRLVIKDVSGACNPAL